MSVLAWLTVGVAKALEFQAFAEGGVSWSPGATYPVGVTGGLAVIAFQDISAGGVTAGPSFGVRWHPGAAPVWRLRGRAGWEMSAYHISALYYPGAGIDGEYGVAWGAEQALTRFAGAGVHVFWISARYEQYVTEAPVPTISAGVAWPTIRLPDFVD